uniref:Uncharacterized protein n=1 Tax=Globodera pallida TaxID=36090 RepID=A0A183C7S3_GLOPA
MGRRFTTQIFKIVIIIFLCSPHISAGQVLFLNTTTIPFVKFYPSDLGIFRVGEHRNLNITIWTRNSTAWRGEVSMDCEQSIGCPLNLLNGSWPTSKSQFVQLDRSNNFSQLFNLSLWGSIVGINRVRVSTDGKKTQNFIVRTQKTEFGSAFTILFTKSLLIAIATGNLLAGIQLNFNHIFANFLHNLCFIFATIICQFIINPMIGFLLANYVLVNQAFVVRLSFFLITCFPAGVGKSNFWTVIFGGDLQAAGILTFIQRLGTIFFAPLWINLLGKKLFVNRVKIVSISVWKALAIMFFPFLIGMLLALCGCQEKMKKIARFFKFLFCAFTLLFVALSVLANSALLWPMFHQLDLLLCCFVLFPVVGHLSALSVGFFLRLSSLQRTTLVVENGVPSVGMAMLLLLWSLGEPERDIAMMAPIGMALLAEKPLLMLCIGKICYRSLKRDTIVANNVKNNGQSIAATNTSNESIIIERPNELEETKNEREI